MKNGFRILGVMMLAVSVTGCFIFEAPPIKSAIQTSSKGIDSNTVQIFYAPLDAIGQKVGVNANSSITDINLDSALPASSDTNPRAVTPTGDTVEKCAVSASGEGCFQVFINAPNGKAGISGKISFKFNGIPLTVNYSGTFFVPPVPASVAVVTTEGVSDVKFKVYFTAKTSSNQPYSISQAGLTEITLTNVNQTNASGVGTRAVIVVPVTSAVSCIALNAGQGCFEFTLGSRTTKASILIEGTVNFKLDGTALALPFAHTFPLIP